MISSIPLEERIDELAALARERLLVPVVGGDLVTVHHADGGVRLLTEAVARDVTRDLKLTDLDPDALRTLDAVCAAALARRIDRPRIGRAVARAFEQHEKDCVTPPEILRLLGAIDWFPVYLSLTGDRLLERAVDAARFSGRPRTASVAYSITERRDLDGDPHDRPDPPRVYHLLGTAHFLPDRFAISEAETLEFFHHLHHPDRQPTRLFDHLRGASLLLLGTALPDWLYRFFLRLCRRDAVWVACHRPGFVVENSTVDLTGLQRFLSAHAAESHHLDIDPLALVHALHAAWSRETGVHEGGGATAHANAALRPGRYVFISYSHEGDRDAAVHLHAKLEAANIPAWLDRDDGLRGGSAWETEIRRRVSNAGVVLP